MESPRDTAKIDAARRIADLKASLIKGMDVHPADEAVGAARSLLDYVEVIITPDLPGSEASFVPVVISRAIPFISEAPDPVEKHLRLIAAAHILTNILRARIESTDDEYCTSQFEDLVDGLRSLEGVDMTNPAIDNRLLTIFQGLLELASAFGLSDVDYLDIRR